MAGQSTLQFTLISTNYRYLSMEQLYTLGWDLSWKIHQGHYVPIKRLQTKCKLSIMVDFWPGALVNNWKTQLTCPFPPAAWASHGLSEHTPLPTFSRTPAAGEVSPVPAKSWSQEEALTMSELLVVVVQLFASTHCWCVWYYSGYPTYKRQLVPHSPAGHLALYEV